MEDLNDRSNEHENPHFNNHWNIHMGCKNYEERGYDFNLDLICYPSRTKLNHMFHILGDLG